MDLEIVSLVHPKKHIEQIFANIPKEGIIGVEKEPYADTMLCPNSCLLYTSDAADDP